MKLFKTWEEAIDGFLSGNYIQGGSYIQNGKRRITFEYSVLYSYGHHKIAEIAHNNAVILTDRTYKVVRPDGRVTPSVQTQMQYDYVLRNAEKFGLVPIEWKHVVSHLVAHNMKNCCKLLYKARTKHQEYIDQACKSHAYFVNGLKRLGLYHQVLETDIFDCGAIEAYAHYAEHASSLLAKDKINQLVSVNRFSHNYHLQKNK